MTDLFWAPILASATVGASVAAVAIRLWRDSRFEAMQLEFEARLRHRDDLQSHWDARLAKRVEQLESELRSGRNRDRARLHELAERIDFVIETAMSINAQMPAIVADAATDGSDLFLRVTGGPGGEGA